jgi:hypothetical protein
MNEDLVRGAFSCLGAAVTLYMASEYSALWLRTRWPWALAAAVGCALLATVEAYKVGRRGETLLGLTKRPNHALRGTVGGL